MKKVYNIGRDQQSDIVINDTSDVVSRLHATIRFNGKKMYLIDLSQNGTYINGMRMSMNEEVPVTRKDKVSFANVAELDWALVPKPGIDTKKILSIAIIAAALIAAIALGVILFNRCDGQAASNVQDTENVTDNSSVEANESFGTSVKDIDTIDNDDKNVDNDSDEEEDDPSNVDTNSNPGKTPPKRNEPNTNPENPTEVKTVDQPTNDIPLY